jgi:hypothetical protein
MIMIHDFVASLVVIVFLEVRLCPANNVGIKAIAGIAIELKGAVIDSHQRHITATLPWALICMLLP